MTVEQGLALTGLVFIFVAFICALAADSSRYVNYLSRPAWTTFALAILCWVAAIWMGVLT